MSIDIKLLKEIFEMTISKDGREEPLTFGPMYAVRDLGTNKLRTYCIGERYDSELYNLDEIASEGVVKSFIEESLFNTSAMMFYLIGNNVFSESESDVWENIAKLPLPKNWALKGDQLISSYGSSLSYEDIEMATESCGEYAHFYELLQEEDDEDSDFYYLDPIDELANLIDEKEGGVLYGVLVGCVENDDTKTASMSKESDLDDESNILLSKRCVSRYIEDKDFNLDYMTAYLKKNLYFWPEDIEEFVEELELSLPHTWTVDKGKFIHLTSGDEIHNFF